MKNACLVVLMLFGSSIAVAQDAKQCRDAYATTVTTCARGLSFLPLATRAGAQTACVKSAQVTRDLCLAGQPSICQQNCQSIFDNAVTVCQTTFDPQANCDDGDVICEAIFIDARANCINAATIQLDTCNAYCTANP